MKFQAIKGVRDILPPDSTQWNGVEQSAREVFASYGFAEIRLPIFEPTELFARSVGLETDIVSKEMYTFQDFDTTDEIYGLWAQIFSGSNPKSGVEVVHIASLAGRFVQLARDAFEKSSLPRTPENQQAIDRVDLYRAQLQVLRYHAPRDTDPVVGALRNAVRDIEFGDHLSLRPEATASVVRAYIEHGMQTQPGNVKLYYVGPMFRRERPQKGRYRQFYQIGAEVLGSSDAPGIDAEVIEMLMHLFQRLKLHGAVLNINSIGDKNCRPAYVERLRDELQKVREQLGPDSQRRIETNPLRVLDSKLEAEQSIIEKLPRIGQHLCDACRAHYEEVKRQLGLRGVAFQENWRLVRGLDYYMRTTFEITAPGLGSQNAVCGGGRYDGLVELLGGPATTKGIGFAIGTDRLMLSLHEAGAMQPPAGLDVFLAWFGEAAQAAAIKLARQLREAGLVVEVPAAEMKFGKALNLADRLKARHAVILGEDEIASGVLTVKRLADGTQQKLSPADLLAYLASSRS